MMTRTAPEHQRTKAAKNKVHELDIEAETPKHS